MVRDDQSFVVASVLDEIRAGCATYRELEAILKADWLSPVSVDTTAGLAAFADYTRILGATGRHLGEAETLAWAEAHDAIAVVDERPGTLSGRERGVEVHGTLWLIAMACRSNLLARHEVTALIDALADAEAWFPAEARGDGFFDWAASHGLECS